MFFNYRLISALAVIFFITGCGQKEPEVKYQPSQAEFMGIVLDNRQQYFTEYEKEFYLDKEKILKNILLKRNELLNSVIKNNEISMWKGKISRMFLTSEGEAWLEVALLDGSKLATNDNTVLQPDSQLFQTLRSYQVGSEVNFSGKFILPKERDERRNEVYFIEKSFTEKGSMEEPEFSFEFTAFHQ